MIHQGNQDSCVNHQAGQAHETEFDELEKQRISVRIETSQMAQVVHLGFKPEFAFPFLPIRKDNGDIQDP